MTRRLEHAKHVSYLRRFIERWDGASCAVQEQLAHEYEQWCDMHSMPHVCAEQNLATLEEKQMKRVTLVTAEKNNAQAIYCDGALYDASDRENMFADSIIEAAGSDECIFDEESVESMPAGGWPETLEELKKSSNESLPHGNSVVIHTKKNGSFRLLDASDGLHLYSLNDDGRTHAWIASVNAAGVQVATNAGVNWVE